MFHVETKTFFIFYKNRNANRMTKPVNTLKIFDKEFRLSISSKEIDLAIARMANQINRDLQGESPLFLCVLNGSFMFASDLLKQITVENTQIAFVRLSSYEGCNTTGKVRQIMGLTENLKDRTVVVLEDIIDTGTTLSGMLKQLEKHQAKQILLASMILKTETLTHQVKPNYTGIKVPNHFIVGRGLDYNGMGRNLPDIYIAI